MRGILKPFGLIVRKGGGQPFETRVREQAAAVPSLQPGPGGTARRLVLYPRSDRHPRSPDRGHGP
jgi:hypothetical protein